LAEHVVELQRLEASIERVVQAIESAPLSSVRILTDRLTLLVNERDTRSTAIREARDAQTLTRVNEVENATVSDELTILRTALAAADEDSLIKIRQGMHGLLRRVIDSATFDEEASHVHVTIRGGFCVKVPHGRSGVVSAGWIMYHPDARSQDATMNPVAMEPEDAEHPAKLVPSKPRLSIGQVKRASMG
jgi:hypothetical protein